VDSSTGWRSGRAAPPWPPATATAASTCEMSPPTRSPLPSPTPTIRVLPRWCSGRAAPPGHWRRQHLRMAPHEVQALIIGNCCCCRTRSTWGAATTPTATGSGSYRSAVSLTRGLPIAPRTYWARRPPVLLRDPTEEPVATLNRQICTQRIAHLAARLVIHTRQGGCGPRITSGCAVPGRLPIVHDYAYECMNMQELTYSIRHVRSTPRRSEGDRDGPDRPDLRSLDDHRREPEDRAERRISYVERHAGPSPSVTNARCPASRSRSAGADTANVTAST
jgi:hypothetical protein